MYFFKTPIFLQKIFTSVTWHKDIAEKKIYLTFDDGPIPEITEWVLDELEKYNAKATFFCVGENINKNPAVFEKILLAGHTVGNHTYNHLNGWKHSEKTYTENIELCTELLGKYNIKRLLFRPPYGRLSPKQYEKLHPIHEIILWSVLTHDYDARLKSEKCLRKSIESTENGSIIVFHDSIKAKKNLYFVLPKYLEHFSELGFTFEKL
jgi:peptidoglycan-N-acetylglucosamine deacetylase